ncbi:T9SS type A sorting domain-containing protein [Weeksellaceae bacterium KMM 9713]|uniref:T9SS type A sorting domain-containing protein n=1 Tax=Profundicola chukchiensis TaxID=2961959 RepID=A0A9X4MWA3_9FLAO|nr:GEVED domain-containing protein [Profundicola chukchiensis]MDG4946043.1 T9SS type A sorting domain-containing protein [Profundicola chukchiensis]
MKKIGLLLLLASFTLQAQNFPAPYCDIEDTSVEEISVINFGTTTITNLNTDSILVDHTDTIADVTPGETYTLSVEGNTYGNFDNNIVAFIDWNQNGVLDDENEIYEIGTISNSTGNDNTSVSMEISVPMDAVAGQTRIRITKVYTDTDSVAVVDPCAISMSILDYGVFAGYGQAVDFTLNIEVDTPEFPAPYCDIEDTSVEELSLINFGTTTITNLNTDSILVDHTDTVADVTPGETYTLSVEGNTYGNFDNNIVAFIDWNQNGVLDDENEVYEIGTISNSTGNDDTTVSMEISVPMDAVPGQTRIRITKVYTDTDSVAVVDPCAISMSILDYGVFAGYGQAVDFTLNIGTLRVKDYAVNSYSAYPVPTKDLLHIKSETNLKSIEVYNLIGQKVLTRNAEGKNIQIDISKLKSGAYIIKLINEYGDQQSFKIIKK